MRALKNSAIIRIIAKALLLLLVINFAFILVKQVPFGKIGLYNTLFQGRERFPFGENPQVSYNLSMYNLDGMLASHEIAGQKKGTDEFRVFVIGDSSVWGFLQKPQDTLSSILDSKKLNCNNKPIRVYNFGYPSLSVVKDMLIIDMVKKYQPDLIIWMVTLESLPDSVQMETPLVANNTLRVNQLIKDYALNEETQPINLMDYTLIARRRELADLIRVQFYGLLWSATGIDQEIPASYTPALRDFDEDYSFHGFQKPNLDTSKLSLDVIRKTIEKNSTIEFMIVNEPVLISTGKNSNIRYDYYYPRWAYDQYRVWMSAEMTKAQIDYVDLWDLAPESEFTNSAIHLNRAGEELLAERISSVLEEGCKKQ